MDNKGIRIYVAMKHMGNIAKKVKERPFMLAAVPHTLRELIAEAVKASIDAYKARASLSQNPTPLTEEQLEAMRELGKFAFGVHYNENATDEVKAIAVATEAVADGLVRVFKGNDEITELDRELEIAEGDVFTFVRLTMLSGIMW